MNLDYNRREEENTDLSRVSAWLLKYVIPGLIIVMIPILGNATYRLGIIQNQQINDTKRIDTNAKFIRIHSVSISNNTESNVELRGILQNLQQGVGDLGLDNREIMKLIRSGTKVTSRLGKVMAVLVDRSERQIPEESIKSIIE